TPTCTIFLPSNRSRFSTSMSTAKMATSAAAISLALSSFSMPMAPWVSTRQVWPRPLAVFSSCSAAMEVWAMPVGQAVTATIFIERSFGLSGLGVGFVGSSPGSLQAVDGEGGHDRAGEDREHIHEPVVHDGQDDGAAVRGVVADVAEHGDGAGDH